VIRVQAEKGWNRPVLTAEGDPVEIDAVANMLLAHGWKLLTMASWRKAHDLPRVKSFCMYAPEPQEQR
jgi:hypothetical protein